MLCFPVAGVVPILRGLLFAIHNRPRGGIGEIVHGWLLPLSFLWMVGGGGHGVIQRGGSSCGRG